MVQEISSPALSCAGRVILTTITPAIPALPGSHDQTSRRIRGPATLTLISRPEHLRGKALSSLWSFVRKLEFDLLLGVIGGINEPEIGNLHQPGAACSVALDPTADFDPLVEPARGDAVRDLVTVDAAQIGGAAFLDAPDLESFVVQVGLSDGSGDGDHLCPPNWSCEDVAHRAAAVDRERLDVGGTDFPARDGHSVDSVGPTGRGKLADRDQCRVP